MSRRVGFLGGVAACALIAGAARAESAASAPSASPAMVGTPVAVGAGPALPTGGVVKAGSASISGSGSGLVIGQTSKNAIIDWSSFSIGQGNSVRFDNGSGATLNRVTGGYVSSIDGLLSGTGSVYLINPNGVIVGKDGIVKVGGSFVASTLDVSNDSFMAGGPLTFSGASSAAVINLGSIGALGGDVVLTAQRVENRGAIDAPKGDVGLLAGTQVLLRDTTSEQGRFAVQVGGADTSVTHTGTITAAMAELRANGGNVYALAGNTDGLIRATGVSEHDGKVFLVAEGGALTANNTIEATRKDGAGGFVETSGLTVDFTGIRVKAKDWLIDPYDLTVDSNAASTISTNLATTNVTLQTSAGGTSGPGNQSSGSGDIVINAGISWSSANTLTLDAYRSININAPITVSGAGKVSLITNDGGTGGDYGFGLSGTTNPAFAGSISFTGTPNSGQALTINGQSYTLIYNVSDLQNIQNNLAGQYALAKDIDASATAGLNGGAGFQPIGTSFAASFSGSLLGSGHTISGLTIANPGTYVGLLGITVNGTVVRDLGLTNVSITATTPADASDRWLGALVANKLAGTISNVFATGTVTGYSVRFEGGLLAWNAGGTLSNSGFSGTVSGSAQQIGGLVGALGQGAISSSWTSGSVNSSSAQSIGGLVGQEFGGAIQDSNSSATVTGGLWVGGLVGSNSASIARSYATGTVSTQVQGSAVGGLVGINSQGGSVDSSYASGSVTGTNHTGGLIGWTNASVSNSYAVGSVTGPGSASTGGLIGSVLSGSTLLNVYSSAKVTNGAGLIGWFEAGNVANAYWDQSTSGQSQGIGLGSSSGVAPVGVSGRGAYNQPSYAGFDFSASGPWVIFEGMTRPMLRMEYSKTITNAHQLQLMALDPTAAYTLGSDIDATGTASASEVGGAGGFMPVGTAATPFTGSLVGGGHKISGLTINRANTDYVGLFGYLGSTALVASVELDGAVIVGRNNVGAMAGYNGGSLTGDTVADFAATRSSVSGSSYVGGLVGQNTGGLSSSASAANVSGTQAVGGLIGINYASVSNLSKSTGFVSGTSWAGGLIGMNYAAVSNSSASVGVSGPTGIGGLIGYNEGVLTSDTTTGGAVSGTTYVGGLVGYASKGQVNGSSVSGGTVTGAANGSGIGGLVGWNLASVTNGTASDAVTSGSNATYTGGLIGYNNGTVTQSVASGTVTAGSGSSYTGGQVGINYGTLQGVVVFNGGFQQPNDTFATGKVSGDHIVGGFVGENDGSISYATAQGAVGGNDSVGGFAGINNGSMTAVHSQGAVTGGSSSLWVGGLAGKNYGTITGVGLNSHRTDVSSASGSVSGSYGTGGFVGYNNGTIDFGSQATGPVTGQTWTGGFAGMNYGSISQGSASSGNVSGNSGVGGFVGYNAGYVDGSTVNLNGITPQTGGTRAGAVNGTTYVGGAVGYNASGGTLTLVSGAATSLQGQTYVGGVAGFNAGSIAGSSGLPTTFNTGSSTYVGGMVGDNYGSISQASAASLSGASYVGGVAGRNYGTITFNSSIGGVTISGSYGVGGVTGINYGTISGATVNGTKVSGATWIGGIAGMNYGTINKNANVFGGTVTATTGAGGIAGYNEGTLDTVYGGVNGNNGETVTADTYAGGVVGYSANGSISNSSSQNITVKATNSTAGGLVGFNISTITGSTSAATVSNGSGTVFTGGLVGDNYGSISSSSASGAVTGGSWVGGLIGRNSGAITGTSSGSVSGNYGVGGLIGENFGSVATGSYSTGTVTGTTWVGALAGQNYGNIGAVTTSNSASGTTGVGGLVGYNEGNIVGASASGNASGQTYVGGLVGYTASAGVITDSSASGTASASSQAAGGLVGWNLGYVARSYATGAVSTASMGGGLLGYNDGTVVDTYATGNLGSSGSYLGGHTGYNDGLIITSWSSGTVPSGSTNGGFVGRNSGNGRIYNSYWDVGTSGQTAGTDASSGGTIQNLTGIGGSTGRSPTAQATYVGFDFNHTWKINEGSSRPYIAVH